MSTFQKFMWQNFFNYMLERRLRRLLLRKVSTKLIVQKVHVW